MTVGLIMRILLEEAHHRGQLTDFTFDFDDEDDER